MKRHPALIPLSEDHHHALVHARHLLNYAVQQAASPTPSSSSLPPASPPSPPSQSPALALPAPIDPQPINGQPLPPAVRDFLAFWDEHGQPHFRLEEEVLLPLYRRDHPQDPLPAALLRILAEHVHIRALVQALRQAKNGGSWARLAQEVGQALQGHVRWEERTAFPLLEDTLSAPALKELEERLRSLHRSPRGVSPGTQATSEPAPGPALESTPGPVPPTQHPSPSSLAPGLAAEQQFVVEPEDAAAAVGSGGLPVLATPTLLAWMERVAYELVAPYLPPDQSTVGTQVELRHLAPTPVGGVVRVRAELTQYEQARRRLIFRIDAFDPWEHIGAAQHERVIIDSPRFLQRVTRKQASAPSTSSSTAAP
ncbi:MAG: hemerythrin domain-containing protein [Limnochordaceae bacterium]|nr:hemerythrin domain-containing protein [Limnochordaceae bacterium]